MTTPHPQAEILHALADGKTIQTKAEKGWFDIRPSEVLFALHGGPNYGANNMRIKPEPVKARYRVAEMRSLTGDIYTTTSDNEWEAKGREELPGFIRWLTDWVEYEVSE